MKVIVTGGNGQLGSALKAQEPVEHIELIYVDLDELDITDASAVTNFFAQHDFDYCINCAAYTAVDKAETETDLASKINVTGAKNLAIACQKHDVTLLHISTDFVFDGNQKHPYTEKDIALPRSVYGQTKLDGEEAIKNTVVKYFIIRTSWLYSEFGNNFLKTMLRLGKERSELGIVSDQIGTPTYAGDLAAVLLKIIQQGSTSYGVYHYSNEGQCSWYDFAKAIFEESALEVITKPIPTTAYPTPAERPKYSVLDKSKIKNTLGIAIPHWEKALKEMITKVGVK